MYNVNMNDLSFAWDDRKNRINRRKHGVSFEEAQTAFLDENAKLYFDPDHSQDEDRFIVTGPQFQPSRPCRLPLLPARRRGHSHNLRSQG
jgi:hypothetical protein